MYAESKNTGSFSAWSLLIKESLDRNEPVNFFLVILYRFPGTASNF